MQTLQENNVTIQPSAYVDAPCCIGDGTTIGHFTHIMSHCTIGQGCCIGQHVVIANDVSIGYNVNIQNNVSVCTGVTLEDDVFCGPSMVFTNKLTPRSAIPQKTSADYPKTLVRKGASIGANATIICGVTIGQYALIGAGAVVTKHVPDYALMMGNPAKQRGWACYCGTPLPKTARLHLLDETLICTVCNRQYHLLDDSILAPVATLPI
jgi:UDP-2-acetamido-3-amino-2,3-dideoxy-glucuronate N-acetyltransferase